MGKVVIWAAPCVAGVAAMTGLFAPAHAATLQSFGHAAGAQCVATDVSDSSAVVGSGAVVGTCSKPPSIAGESTNGLAAAWYATTGTSGTPGAQIRLQPLVSGHSCTAAGVTMSGRIIGSCDRASGVSTGVHWTDSALSAPPVELSPLPGLLGLGADISTAATGYNQFGSVIGQSFADKASTAVVWPRGSGTPVQVSTRNDDCIATDVMEQSAAGNPTILLNCPYVGLDASLRNTVVPQLATPTGLLGAYVMTPLAKNSSATDCVAQSINATSRIAGSCRLPVAPFVVAATWASPSGAAAIINVRDANNLVLASASEGLNDLGHMVISYETADGRSNAGFIDLSVSPATFKRLPPLHPGTNVKIAGLGENDLVLVLGLNDGEHAQAAVWNPVSPSVLTPVPVYGGGTGNAVSTMSKGGSYAVGAAVDSSHVVNAVVATLP